MPRGSVKQGMRNSSVRNNERLPVDVLAEVFAIYQAQEGYESPLEAMLLVCKFWSMAALSCRSLWGKLLIPVGNEPFFKAWVSRLPNRLTRSGSSVHLDIIIDVHPISPPHSWSYPTHQAPRYIMQNARKTTGMPYCVCNRWAGSIVDWAVDILAGENGEMCARWRSLDLRLCSHGGYDCLKLPPQLSGLTKLVLSGRHPPQSLNSCLMPRISHLDIKIDDQEMCSALVKECSDFPFHQIKRLGLSVTNKAHSIYSLDRSRDSLLMLLRLVAPSLTSLSSPGFIFSIVLKWIWEAKQSLAKGDSRGQSDGVCFRNKVVFSTRDSSRDRELTGDEGCEELESLALDWGLLSPGEDWDVIIVPSPS